MNNNISLLLGSTLIAGAIVATHFLDSKEKTALAAAFGNHASELSTLQASVSNLTQMVSTLPTNAPAAGPAPVQLKALGESVAELGAARQVLEKHNQQVSEWLAAATHSPAAPDFSGRFEKLLAQLNCQVHEMQMQQNAFIAAFSHPPAAGPAASAPVASPSAMAVSHTNHLSLAAPKKPWADAWDRLPPSSQLVNSNTAYFFMVNNTRTYPVEREVLAKMSKKLGLARYGYDLGFFSRIQDDNLPAWEERLCPAYAAEISGYGSWMPHFIDGPWHWMRRTGREMVTWHCSPFSEIHGAVRKQFLKLGREELADLRRFERERHPSHRPFDWLPM